jgi:hypothetical protein
MNLARSRENRAQERHFGRDVADDHTRRHGVEPSRALGP